MYPPPYNKHLEISIFKVIAAEFHLQLLTLKAGVKLNILIQVNQIKRRCMYTSDLAYRKLLAKPETVLREIVKLPNINLQ